MGVDIHVHTQQTLTLPAQQAWEYGILVIKGSVTAENGITAHADELLFIEPHGNSHFNLTAEANTHLMLLGGEPLPHPTLIWWNFVADSREALCQAVDDWNQDSPRFGAEIDLNGTPLKRLIAPEVPAGLGLR